MEYKDFSLFAEYKVARTDSSLESFKDRMKSSSRLKEWSIFLGLLLRLDDMILESDYKKLLKSSIEIIKEEIKLMKSFKNDISD